MPRARRQKATSTVEVIDLTGDDDSEVAEIQAPPGRGSNLNKHRVPDTEPRAEPGPEAAFIDGTGHPPESPPGPPKSPWDCFALQAPYKPFVPLASRWPVAVPSHARARGRAPMPRPANRGGTSFSPGLPYDVARDAALVAVTGFSDGDRVGLACKRVVAALGLPSQKIDVPVCEPDYDSEEEGSAGPMPALFDKSGRPAVFLAVRRDRDHEKNLISTLYVRLSFPERRPCPGRFVSEWYQL